ncbi:hypothetical protein HZP84_00565 [Elizabethkingia anophelis]|uniref:Lipoprotein n=2 Tax=Elizabethkingia anophelis TaxID=1117645 RepID=A0A1T3E6Q2_9FLAO|nr:MULTISPECIES: hypothetical protein [Elizabethkingia]AIL44882.1 hypothetical protein BD94_1107 [Elizabethkingia anophelis NUHP1]AMR39903.1 hypothetical protein A2T74_00360 [Elizabethkingia anophelis]AMX46541.1 hypothetical protein A4C56_00360 [Elizabethkingia anophelis]AMX50000.1 hypothetical protein A2T72_00360 [Elizabethkingia anophelis]AMX53391.1 hypothetical protein A2T59_00360 [Elizabethkingia anophelis]
MKKLILLVATGILLLSNTGCREAEELGTIGGSTPINNTASVNDTKLTNDNIIKNLKDQQQDPEKKKINPVAETADTYKEKDRQNW